MITLGVNADLDAPRNAIGQIPDPSLAALERIMLAPSLLVFLFGDTWKSDPVEPSAPPKPISHTISSELSLQHARFQSF
jgi:hypothetical protein